MNELDPTMATKVWEAVKSVTCYSISELSRVPNELEETMSDQSRKKMLCIAKYTACRCRGKELIEETEEEQRKGDVLAGILDRVSES